MTTQSAALLPARVEPLSEGYRTAYAFLGGTAVALVLAVLAGPSVAVIGLVLFGALHNWLELRYLFGTYRDAAAFEVLPLLLVLISGIVVCRLAVPGDVGRRIEILLAAGVLAAALVRALRPAPLLRAAGLLLVAAFTAGSLVRPDLNFVALAHLHNLLPALFVWHWARDLDRGPRRLLRATQVGWTLVVPIVLLAGAADRWFAGLDRLPLGAPGSVLVAQVTPRAWVGDTVSLRLVTVFAFLQTVHYLVWVWFLPRHDRGAARRFATSSRVGRRLAGWRFGVGAGVCALLLGSVFWSDYVTGRSLYLSFTSFHAYLELAVLLALLGPVTREVLHER